MGAGKFSYVYNSTSTSTKQSREDNESINYLLFKLLLPLTTEIILESSWSFLLN